MANPNDDDGSKAYRITLLEDLIDDARTATNTALGNIDQLVATGRGATHEQLVALQLVIQSEAGKLNRAV